MAENNILPFSVLVGATSFLSDITDAKEALHEAMEIKCFYEGSSTLLIGNESVNVTAGDVVVINPYEFHATINCGEENIGKYHRFIIPLDYFYDKNFKDLDLRELFFTQNKKFKTLFHNDTELVNLLTLAAREQETCNVGYQILIKATLIKFFVILLRRGLRTTETSDKPSNNARTYTLIEPAMRHIRDNYNQDISVEFLAELCNVSKHYFCRAFKMATGKTAMEYLRDYRMRIAEVLITNTWEPIAKIAVDCGFENEPYFCKCYKRYYGISPSKSRSIRAK